VAVKVTDKLVENGIGAIWNFTNVELTAPNSPIIVENMHFSDSLLSLSYYISDNINEETARQNRLNRM
jgi:redox-sensing transcriptional repressor